MVNWSNPQTIETQYLIFIKFVHFTAGIFVWEVAVSLDFEWKLITGKKELKWPVFPYVACRLITFVAVACELAFLNITTEFDCNAFEHALVVFGYLSLAISAFLILLRTIAIWNRHFICSSLAIALWLLNVSLLIWGAVKAPVSVWDPASGSCVELNADGNKLNITVTFLTDVANLLLALLGLWVYKGAGNFWLLVYRQGMVWVTIAIMFYTPATVFIWLNLNTPMDLMFQIAICIAMAICATRMFRGLNEYDTNIIPSFAITRSMQFGQAPGLHAQTESTFVPMSHYETSDRPSTRVAQTASAPDTFASSTKQGNSSFIVEAIQVSAEAKSMTFSSEKSECL